MQQLVEGIRGVAGVWGVILWDRRADRYHQVLPARIKPQAVERLCGLFSTFCRENHDANECVIKLADGWLSAFFHPTYAIMVLARNDLNRATLRLVIKSALTSLQHTLGHEPQTPVAEGLFTPEHAAAVARSINLVLSFYRGKLPKFEISTWLRQAKADLLDEYPVLKNVSVDLNGGVTLIRGAEANIDSSIVPAAAGMIKVFLELTSREGQHSGLDIRKQTEELQPLLSDLGFYDHFKQSDAVRK